MPKQGKVLFFGLSYYHTNNIADEMRKRGWRADTLNFDDCADNNIFYHGEDFKFTYNGITDNLKHLAFYIKSLKDYDIFHFSNMGGIKMLQDWYRLGNRIPFLPEYWDIKLLKKLGKKIVYSNNSCHDGLLQSTFAQQGYFNTCSICRWKDVPKVCSDEKMKHWGEYRNSVVDFHVHNGGHKADYNLHPSTHDVPEFYCLDSEVWNPDLLIPSNYRLSISEDTVKIYHAVGLYNQRTKGNVNAKTSHIIIPSIEKLKKEGHNVELIFVNDVPNKHVKYYQMQADIVADMLTYGWFGANIREAMMLGKPCICYINPEWRDSIGESIPEYARDLPIVSATVDTFYDRLKELVVDAEKRKDIGRRSRAFAERWHSKKSAGEIFERIYTSLIKNKEFRRNG
ncbi:glycosyltransferase [Limisalsivibrio acetivorans]|uniref:glycosyltransferase n=1 Tax=Limisalsivibrio acetivorans TaxID=1304888 RepID=UPI0003B4A0B9|nr:glycosyltransferase [Limisalsivibrio acetivorans]